MQTCAFSPAHAFYLYQSIRNETIDVSITGSLGCAVKVAGRINEGMSEYQVSSIEFIGCSSALVHE